MLSIIGFLMMTIFLIVIMKKKMSPLTALILIPVITAILIGYSSEIGSMMKDGVEKTSLTGVMIIFAIMYFSMMADTGLFVPVVNIILNAVKNDPVRTTVGTVILSAVVALDGEGTSTYLIVVAALFPLYKKLKINPLILTCIVTLTAGIMNLLPWSAPSARVSSALRVDPSVIFLKLSPLIAIGLLWVLLVAFILGKRERARIKKGAVIFDYSGKDMIGEVDESLRRPKLIFFNFILTLVLIVTMALNLIPLPIAFMLAFAIGMVINFPMYKDQQKVIKRHAGNALNVSALIFAAGIFTGILEGTGIIKAMGASVVTAIPQELGGYLSVFSAILSLPFTFFLTNDAYYFGILPIIITAGEHFNVSAEVLGRGSLIGQAIHLLSPLVPSAYLLASLVGVEYADHLKFSIKWALGAGVILLIASVILGII